LQFSTQVYQVRGEKTKNRKKVVGWCQWQYVYTAEWEASSERKMKVRFSLIKVLGWRKVATITSMANCVVEKYSFWLQRNKHKQTDWTNGTQLVTNAKGRKVIWSSLYWSVPLL
jgi:hypothetical protein